jgi:gamma-aminobutyric acid type B receptor
MNVTKPFSRFVHTTYDAVWSIALALKSAEQSWRNESRVDKKRKRKKLDVFDYSRTDLAKDFVEQFRRLKFQGISVIYIHLINFFLINMFEKIFL